MPLHSSIGAGGIAVTRGRVFYRRTFSLTGGGPSDATGAVEVIGKDRIVFFARATSGDGVLVRPEFSVASETGVGGVPAYEWLPLQPDAVLPNGGASAPGVFLSFTVPCRFVRLVLTPDANNATVQVAIMAT